MRCTLTEDAGISVIVPNYNSRYISHTLASLRAQRYDEATVEVLVVGVDEPGLVQEDTQVRHIKTKTPVSPAVARNIGIDQSTGDVLCFLDADCRARPDWLAILMERVKEGGADVVGGGVVYDVEGYWSLCDNLSWFHLFSAERPAGQRQILPSLNLVVRRSVIEAVGTFDERYPRPAGEDAEWTTRMRLAGYELWFEPRAVVEHHPRRSGLMACLRHAYAYGRYSVKVHREHFDRVGTPWFLRSWPALLLLAPFLSAGATTRVYWTPRVLARYWYTIPGIWLTKLLWCLGAAARLWSGGF